MALTYAQMDALTTDETFLARVRTAVRLIARYHYQNANSTDAQRAWASLIFDIRRTNQVASDLVGELVADGAILGAADRAAIDALPDDNFKGAVELICFRYTGA